MKIKLIELINAYIALMEIKNTNKIPFALAWQISDITEVLEKHNVRFNNERNELLKKYGEENKEKKGFYDFSKDNGVKFNKEIEILSNIIIEIKGVQKLDKKILFDSGIKINENVNIIALKLFVK